MRWCESACTYKAGEHHERGNCRMPHYYKLILAFLLFASSCASFAADPFTPGFRVPERTDQFEFQPCSACHEYMETNPNPRLLEEAPHYAEVLHGNAHMWCSTCHSLQPGQRDKLKLPSGNLVNMDQGYLVCAQCHNLEYRDWIYGAHGKRIDTWRGDRIILSCMECHNPHLGSGIQPRQPVAPPSVRKGLHKQKRHRYRQHCRHPWNECAQEQNEVTNGEQ
jgi:hypothetical protein